MVKKLFPLALLAAAFATQADTLERVEIFGAKVRTDVSRACPTAQASLEAAMGPTVARYQIAGSYTVLFDLNGNRISDVHTPRLPDEYRQPLRNAVRKLQCNDAAAATQTQRFGFIVDVRYEEDAVRGGRSRVAMGVLPLQ